MPKHRRPLDNRPLSFRPGALQRARLDSLIEYRGQQQTTVLNAAIDLLWLLDIGYEQMGDVMSIKAAADVLTDNGRDEP